MGIKNDENSLYLVFFYLFNKLRIVFADDVAIGNAITCINKNKFCGKYRFIYEQLCVMSIFFVHVSFVLFLEMNWCV